MKQESLKMSRFFCAVMVLLAIPAFAGIQLSKNTLNFGDVPKGTFVEQTFTVTNTFATIVSLSLTPTGDFFTFSPTILKLDPNQTQTVTVRIAELATAGGQNGSILIAGNGASKTITVKAKIIDPFFTKVEPLTLNFGTVAVNSSKELTISVKNKSNSQLNYAFSANSGQVFSLNPVSKSLAAGQSVNLKVTFTPTLGKSFTDILGVTATTTAGVSSKVAKMAVSGTGLSASGFIGLIPTVLDFGDVDRGSGKQLSITVKNNSTASADFTVTKSGNFVVATAPFTLFGGGEKVVGVNVEAGVPPGTMTGTVTFTSGSTSGTVNMAAKVFDPLGTEINPLQLDFGTVNTGQTKSLTFTVKNTSPGSLTYNTIGNPSLYTGSPATLNLSAGQTGTFTVTFNPGSARGNLPGVLDVRAASGTNNIVVGNVNLQANVP